MMSSGNLFILSQKVKGQGHESKNIAVVDLCTLVSAGFFYLEMLPLNTRAEDQRRSFMSKMIDRGYRIYQTRPLVWSCVSIISAKLLELDV